MRLIGVDGALDYLVMPSTTDRLATFHKNYHDALIDKGFTEDQAFQLLLNLGSPLRTLMQ